MNNTQQAGETAVEEILNSHQQLFSALIKLVNKGIADSPQAIKAVEEAKRINRMLADPNQSRLIQSAPAPAPDAVEAKRYSLSYKELYELIEAGYRKGVDAEAGDVPNFFMFEKWISSLIAALESSPAATQAKTVESKARLYANEFSPKVESVKEQLFSEFDEGISIWDILFEAFVCGAKSQTPTYLAGHAAGQKATVEAKSAGVWVKASDFKQVPTTPKNFNAKWSDTGFPLVVPHYGDHRGWGVADEYIETLLILDETPTSHAEGEKGAVGFAEWISVEDRLPEDEEELVIITAIRKENETRFVSVSRKGTFNYFLFDTVTHWMPLPPPPTK